MQKIISRISGKNQEIYKGTSLFVANICRNRNTVHGLDHAQKTTYRALNIYSEICQSRHINMADNYIQKIILAGLIHDIPHNYYDPENKLILEINKYLKYFDNSELIIRIIQRIPFSLENNMRETKIKSDWTRKLGLDGLIIRNIISDADKLESLGKSGINRVSEFIRSDYYNNNQKNIQDNILSEKLKQIGSEKLLRIKSEFLYTIPGILMAEPLHAETEKILDK